MPAKNLFSKDITVEYRVVPTLDGGTQWHWVLFNTMDKVLGGGTAQSRGKAGVESRRKARQLRRHIRKVRVAGLAESKKPIDVRKFIDQMSNWMELASTSGYEPTADKFWAKAANGEPVYARKIEWHANLNRYTISIFGGTGKAKGGGLLVWVAVDYEDIGNHNRIPLHTFLTTERNLPGVLGHIELVCETYGDSWEVVDRVLKDWRKIKAGIIEAQEDTGLPQARPPVNPVTDFIMGLEPWEERLTKLTGGWGPRAYKTTDPEMKRSAIWLIQYGFQTCYVEFNVLVWFEPDKVPGLVTLRVDYMHSDRGEVSTKYNEAEHLQLNGHAQMNEFVDHLEPVVKTVEKWHTERYKENQPTQWDFARLVSNLLIWMANQPQMAEYI